MMVVMPVMDDVPLIKSALGRAQGGKAGINSGNRSTENFSLKIDDEDEDTKLSLHDSSSNSNSASEEKLDFEPFR